MAYGINVRLIHSMIGRSHYLVETVAFPAVWIFHYRCETLQKEFCWLVYLKGDAGLFMKLYFLGHVFYASFLESVEVQCYLRSWLALCGLSASIMFWSEAISANFPIISFKISTAWVYGAYATPFGWYFWIWYGYMGTSKMELVEIMSGLIKSDSLLMDFYFLSILDVSLHLRLYFISYFSLQVGDVKCF